MLEAIASGLAALLTPQDILFMFIGVTYGLIIGILPGLANLGISAKALSFVTSGGVVHNCRPPGNRNPEPQEALQCEPYLHRQIELIRPKLIIALGKVAAANLLRSLADKSKAWADLLFAVRTLKDLQTGKSAST